MTAKVLTWLPILFLLMDAVMKLIQPKEVVDATTQLGYDASIIMPLGLALLIGVLLYTFQKTSMLGAITLTGYLGGAVATHVRVGSPLLSHVLFPVYLGILLWAGLYFRETRFRRLIRESK